MEKVLICFYYNGDKTIIESIRDKYMKDIFKKYKLAIKNEIKDIIFLYNGNIIDKGRKLKEINSIDD